MEYYEGAAIACCLGLLGTMWLFLQRLISSKLAELYEIIVKLIERHNQSDTHADRRHEQIVEKVSELEGQISQLREKVSFLQGRINGKTSV
ncbi:hypothetical protein [Pseudoalteromonas lipolytica]|uniref:hypothetical protein n=1 Tax=Pseudoalteromonas lipolytica TaxID=570156 RepID=UPI00241F82B5|nr:hypothetical protein [Pseudoalteromonas lipolytica]|tara:strand:- start:5 stop:277 length:273 start_codon:yes stop_codon:yes gene_type:complete